MVAEARRQQPRQQISAHSQPIRSGTPPAGNIQLGNKGFRNENGCLSVENFVPSPVTKQTPLVQLQPSRYFCFTDLLFPHGKHDVVTEQRDCNSEELIQMEYVSIDETEIKLRDVYGGVTAEGQPLECASVHQCSEERGSTMFAPKNSACYDAPLSMLNTKDFDKGHQDQMATGTNDGCTRKQQVPYVVKEKLLCGTPADLMQLLTTVGRVLYFTPLRLTGFNEQSVLHLNQFRQLGLLSEEAYTHAKWRSLFDRQYGHPCDAYW